MTKGQVKAALVLKRQVLRLGIPYREIAALSQRSWSLVYHVLNGRKTAPIVTVAARQLVEEARNLHNGRVRSRS